jgi:cytosine/adenosine deaminase-related metal-dependent hydrolase
MKQFSAQYIFTNNGSPLKRAIISTDDDGKILNIEETGGNLKERQSVEFHNGIIIPGFVNCHCHLELSHLRGTISQGDGLGNFIKQIRNTRNSDSEKIITSSFSSDDDMYREGIVLCADICNTDITFGLKEKSRIRYLNLLEVFGIDPDKAGKRMNELVKIAAAAEKMGLIYSLVPHSVYSMSRTLLKHLKEKSKGNLVTSIHYMETPGEVVFLKNHAGPLFITYQQAGLIPVHMETVTSHTDAVLHEITRSGNLILVHNTFADKETIKELKYRGNLFWCLCPNSNIFIENNVPPVPLFIDEKCEIVIGTDSLASNNRLSILEEIKTLQQHFPSLSIEELVRWATLNGAKALCMDDEFGKIEPGKKPGLLLLQNVDLINMKLQPDSFITRLT